LFVVAAASVCAGAALAQTADPLAKSVLSPRPEVAIGFSMVRSNAPVGGCTCFYTRGGSATFAWPLARTSFSIVGDITATHTSAITSNNYGLMLASFTAGARYTPRLRSSIFRPYGQATLGFAHSSDTLVSSATASVPNAGAAFAAQLGGGVDVAISRRIRFRIADIDYLLSTFDNGSNNRQNSLRLDAGFVYRF
jgi:hypothetical protein